MNITSTLIIQMIVFLILIWFTMKFVWPPIAAALWHAFGAGVPYWFAAGSVLVATLTIFLGRRVLARIDEAEADAADEGAAVLLGDAA